jgi:hypothetical protein
MIRSLLLTFSLAHAPVCAAVQFEVQPLWADHVALAGLDRGAALLFADVQGDSRSELLVALGLARTFDSPDIGRFAVLARDDQDTWSVDRVVYSPTLGEVQDFALLPHGVEIEVATISSATSPDRSWISIFGGRPLALRRTFQLPIPSISSRVHAGDVDADGDLDLVYLRVRPTVITESVLEARDASSGAVLWSVTIPDRIHELVLHQLDADAALEIALSNTTPGLVLDGAMGEQQWGFSGGFGAIMLAGDFEPENDVRLASLQSGMLTAFHGIPALMQDTRAVPLGPPTAAVADLDDDGRDEIVFGGGNYLIVERGAPDRTLTPERTNHMRSLDVDRGDPNLPKDIASVGDFMFWSTVHLTLLDSDTGSTHREWPSFNGAAMPLVRGDLSGTGADEVATFESDRTAESNSSPIRLRIRDATTGAILREGMLPSNIALPKALGVTAMQIDSDPALELVVGREATRDASYVAIDAVSLLPQWVGADLPAEPQSYPFDVVRLADVDVDGDMELIVASLLTATPGLIQALDPASAAIDREWSPPRQTTDEIDVIQFDADPALELLVWQRLGFAVLDGATGAAEDLSAFGIIADHAHNMVAWRQDGECRFSFFSGSVAPRIMRHFRCDGTDLGYVPLFFAADVSHIETHSGVPGQWLLFASGELALFDPTNGRTTRAAERVGPGTGDAGGGYALRQDASGATLWLANDGIVRSLSIDSPTLFDDGFE